MMRELPSSEPDIDIDPALYQLAERAAHIAGMPVDAWLERAIRRACPEYFAPMVLFTPQAPASHAESPLPMAPLQAPVSGAGAALAELIARARQPQTQPATLIDPVAAPAPVAMPSLFASVPDVPSPAERQPSPIEHARESAQRAAAFAVEVADWRGRDERPAQSGTPWPVFNDGTAEESYVPLDNSAGLDIREPLELRSPISAWRSRQLLLIAAGIAVAIAFGTLAAQRYFAERFDQPTVSESAAIIPSRASAPASLPVQAALPPSTPIIASAPSTPSKATPATPPSAIAAASSGDTGAAPPPVSTVAAATPAAPSSAALPPGRPAQNSVPIVSEAAPPAAAIAPQSDQSPVAVAQPDTPPPLPPRKIAAAKPTPETSAQHAETVAADANAPKDPAQLASWLEQRAKNGDAVAEYRLGVLYALGQGVKQDYTHAAQLFKAAANGGVAEAQYNVAVMYSEGMGVKRDPVEAVNWYEKAAEQGNANAAFNLGVAYSNGAGVQQSMPEAARWFRRAAAAGVINAQFNLGLLYERGEGVPPSLIEAYAWYAAAAARGDQGAAQRRDHIARALTSADFKKAQVRAAELQQTAQLGASPILPQKADAATP